MVAKLGRGNSFKGPKMAFNKDNTNNNPRPLLLPEIGPDGLPRESSVISYTEKIIEEEQLQLRKYIQENYSKIRDVEKELANLNLEMKLTAGPKKAGREDASKAVKDEEAIKQKLCEDLNSLVQESNNAQFCKTGGTKKETGGFKSKQIIHLFSLCFQVQNLFTYAESKAFIRAAESIGFVHQGSLGPTKGEAYRDNDRISVNDPVLADAIWESGLDKLFSDFKI